MDEPSARRSVAPPAAIARAAQTAATHSRREASTENGGQAGVHPVCQHCGVRPPGFEVPRGEGQAQVQGHRLRGDPRHGGAAGGYAGGPGQGWLE
eukprot:6803125-Pyramimonas_sp.AAC.1